MMFWQLAEKKLNLGRANIQLWFLMDHLIALTSPMHSQESIRTTGTLSGAFLQSFSAGVHPHACRAWSAQCRCDVIKQYKSSSAAKKNMRTGNGWRRQTVQKQHVLWLTIAIFLFTSSSYTPCQSRYAKNHSEECHAHIHSILGLAEVGGAWVGVDGRTDLVNTRQRVHDNHLLFGLGQNLRSQHIAASDLIILLGRREALALNARHVQDIGVDESLLQR
eukprot:scpid5447/ scgid19239/ 